MKKFSKHEFGWQTCLTAIIIVQLVTYAYNPKPFILLMVLILGVLYYILTGHWPDNWNEINFRSL